MSGNASAAAAGHGSHGERPRASRAAVLPFLAAHALAAG